MLTTAYVICLRPERTDQTADGNLRCGLLTLLRKQFLPVAYMYSLDQYFEEGGDFLRRQVADSPAIPAAYAPHWPVDNSIRCDARDTSLWLICDATDTPVSAKCDATDTPLIGVIHRRIAIPDPYGMQFDVVGSRVDRQQPFDHVNRAACNFDRQSLDEGRQAGFASTDIHTR